MDKKTYEDKSFWVALGLIAILSSIVIIISAEDGTIPTGALVSSAEKQHIFSLPPGRTTYIQARQIPGLSVVELTAAENIKEVDVTIATEEVAFEGKVYSAFTIRSVPEAVFRVKLILKIPQQELDALGIKAEKVQLLVNNKEAPLTVGRSAKGYLAYEAQTPELGTFVIGERAEEPLPLAPPPLEPVMAEGGGPEPSTIPVQQPVPKPSFWERLKEWFS